MSNTTQATAEVAPAPGPLVGLGILVIVLVAIVAWAMIGGRLLSDVSLFGGFLMLWYWANVEQLSVARLPAALIGALVGIGLAWGLLYGVVNYGGTGLLVGLLLLIVALYLDIIKAAPLFVNASTMLYVTIAAAPLVQLKVDWIELCLATVGGGVFFAAFVETVKWLAGKLLPTPA
ncbi:MAG: hypothetical protein RLZZ84_1525 [Pseudomonadota bacterium]|jgi:hypothetical protein